DQVWLAQAYPSGWSLPPVGLKHLYLVNNLILTVLALLAVAEYLFPLVGIEIAASGSLLKLAEPVIPQPWRFSTKQNGVPGSTYCVLLLWLWCGWKWLQTPEVQAARLPENAAGGPPAPRQ